VKQRIMRTRLLAAAVCMSLLSAVLLASCRVVAAYCAISMHHARVHACAAFAASCRTIDGKDWALGGNKDKCADFFNVYGPPTVQQGMSGVVLMHAAPWGIGICPDTLDRLIQYWKEAGYSFVTVRRAQAGCMLQHC
jgi:peptidoglycan/xylan/chitin deacetylase (PgdA/CDA1 family)